MAREEEPRGDSWPRNTGEITSSMMIDDSGGGFFNCCWKESKFSDDMEGKWIFVLLDA